MNFIKTAGAVATGIVLSQLAKDFFGKVLDGVGSLTNRTSGNDEPEAPAKKATK